MPGRGEWLDPGHRFQILAVGRLEPDEGQRALVGSRVDRLDERVSISIRRDRKCDVGIVEKVACVEAEHVAINSVDVHRHAETVEVREETSGKSVIVRISDKVLTE